MCSTEHHVKRARRARERCLNMTDRSSIQWRGAVAVGVLAGSSSGLATNWLQPMSSHQHAMGRRSDDRGPRRKSAVRFDVHALFFADKPMRIERILHQHFAARRLNRVNLLREDARDNTPGRRTSATFNGYSTYRPEFPDRYYSLAEAR